MKTLGLQLYTIRDFLKDEDFMDLSLKKIHDMGITEAQTAGIPPMGWEKFADLCKKNDIQIVGTHYSWEAICNRFEETVAVHRMLGTTNIGIGGMVPWGTTDPTVVKEFIRNFNELARRYAAEGFKLTYHNHNFEFVRVDGTKTIMDLLYENLDPENTSFVLDTCWVAAGSGDVREWIEKLAGRIDILHLKDVQLIRDAGKFCGTMTEIGNGTIAWDPVIEAAEKAGVKHFVIEQDARFIDGDPFKSLKVSTDFLKKYIH